MKTARVTWRRVRELAALVDEVAWVDWRHPAWWALIGGASLGEDDPLAADADSAAAALAAVAADDLAAWRAADADYLASDGGPIADTFMARPYPAADDPAARIAAAIAGARAATTALAEQDGRFPGQPLRCHLATGAIARRAPCFEPRRVAFVGRGGAFAAVLGDERDDLALAAALAQAMFAPSTASTPSLLLRIDPGASTAISAAVCISLLDEPLASARHLHRRAWSRGGGPWLGLGRAEGHDVVSTCHMIVDGYGHGCLAAAILAGRDRRLARDGRALAAAAAAAGAPTIAPRTSPTPPIAGARPLGIASHRLEEGSLRLAPLAYAAGRITDARRRAHDGRSPGRRADFRADAARARHSPTFQVPIAPGDRADPLRLRRRVLPALLSLRADGTDLESPAAFAARLPAFVAREAAGRGLLARLQAAARRAPAPLALKRRIVAPSETPRRFPAVAEVLGGRACVSLLRFAAADRPPWPLLAASSPALDDELGGAVITIVVDGAGATLTICGAGGLADPAAAAAFLDRYLAESIDAAAAMPRLPAAVLRRPVP